MMEKNSRTIEIVDQYIANLSGEIQVITQALREMILQVSTDLREEYKWSMPNYSYNGLVCYLQASKKHVNLGFHKGNELEKMDSHRLLQGSGKNMRHIRITHKEDIQTETFISFIQAAMKLNES